MLKNSVVCTFFLIAVDSEFKPVHIKNLDLDKNEPDIF